MPVTAPFSPLPSLLTTTVSAGSAALLLVGEQIPVLLGNVDNGVGKVEVYGQASSVVVPSICRTGGWQGPFTNAGAQVDRIEHLDGKVGLDLADDLDAIARHEVALLSLCQCGKRRRRGECHVCQLHPTYPVQLRPDTSIGIYSGFFTAELGHFAPDGHILADVLAEKRAVDARGGVRLHFAAVSGTSVAAGDKKG